MQWISKVHVSLGCPVRHQVAMWRYPALLPSDVKIVNVTTGRPVRATWRGVCITSRRRDYKLRWGYHRRCASKFHSVCVCVREMSEEILNSNLFLFAIKGGACSICDLMCATMLWSEMMGSRAWSAVCTCSSRCPWCLKQCCSFLSHSLFFSLSVSLPFSFSPSLSVYLSLSLSLSLSRSLSLSVSLSVSLFLFLSLCLSFSLSLSLSLSFYWKKCCFYSGMMETCLCIPASFFAIIFIFFWFN